MGRRNWRREANAPGVLASAVSTASALLKTVRPGKQALRRRDRDSLAESARARVSDSCDLDGEYPAAGDDSARWDYLVGLTAPATTAVIGVEVHPCNPGEVERVIRKRAWAKAVLAREGVPQLVSQWWWVVTGAMTVTKTAPQYRKLAHSGILVARRIAVDDCLGS